MHDYQRFFNELAPRLKTARVLERELDLQLARRFNALDYLLTDELGLSRIIADLLNPRGSHGQGVLFLKLLLDKIKLLPTQGNLGQALVEVEKTIKGDRRLDICVRIEDDERKHCLAIENKPYAGDQENQIKDYLDWLKAEYDEFMLIYLSPEGEPPSSDSIELNYLEKHSMYQSFRIMPYHETQGDGWEDEFGDYRLDYPLTEWLADCRKNCDVDRLRWFLGEAKAFCQRTFGGNIMAGSEGNAIQEFVLSNRQNWDTALEICKHLPEIKEQVCSTLLERIWETWPSRYTYPDDLCGDWGYRASRGKCYIAMYRESWKPYQAWTHRSYGGRTHLRLEAADSGPNQWFIGVCSPNDKLTADEEERRQKLGEAIRSIENKDGGEAWWPWWKWVDEKYLDWDPLIPGINDECQNGGGEVINYFVEEFAKLAKRMIPIIDRIEGA